MLFSISIGLEVDGVIDLMVDDLNCGLIDDCILDSFLCFEIEFNSFIVVDIDIYVVILWVYDFCGNVDFCIIDVIIIEEFVLGIVKRLVLVENNEDGFGMVMYEFNIENFGDVDLDSL